MKQRIFIGMLLLGSMMLAGFIGVEAKWVIKVVDENGAAVDGADISGGFWSPKTKSGKGDHFEGLTDSQGLFVAEGTAYQDMRYAITKQGYYRTIDRIKISNYDEAWESGKWQPYGATNISVLKAIKNPIPMYVKRVRTKVPVLGEACGFDLMVGDWVEPHGKGVVSHFTFVVSGVFEERRVRRVALQLSCDGDGNGIVETSVTADATGPTGSEFWSLHHAPSSGYNNKWEYKLVASTNSQERVFPEEKDKGVILYFRTKSAVVSLPGNSGHVRG